MHLTFVILDLFQLTPLQFVMSGQVGQYLITSLCLWYLSILHISSLFVVRKFQIWVHLSSCVSNTTAIYFIMWKYSVVVQGDPQFQIHKRKYLDCPTTKRLWVTKINSISFTTQCFDQSRQYWKCFILGEMNHWGLFLTIYSGLKLS